MRHLGSSEDQESRVQGELCRVFWPLLIPYQGKWTVPKIPNPEYKGPWEAKKIANPAFFEDSRPSDFTKIAGIGIELWTMTEDILCRSDHAFVTIV